jgi:hypothetical protein
MYWATTTFKVVPAPGLADALRSWRDHISVAHPKVAEVRCYVFDGGTSVVWQEGFRDFHDYQALVDETDDVCDGVMGAVFAHLVPGTREGKIWSDGIAS